MSPARSRPVLRTERTRASSRPLLAASVVLGALALAGCAVTPRVPSGPPLAPSAALPLLQHLGAFQLSGRVAGAVDQEGFSAQLELVQRGERASVELRSPLGFGSARVETDGRTLEYRSSRGERLSGEEGLRALAARLGFEPPLASLRYWLLGVPDPEAPATPLEGAPGEQGFEQLGWRISAREPQLTSLRGERVALPRRVTLERQPVRLRVLIEKWRLP